MDIPDTDLADQLLRVARRLRRAMAAALASTPLNPHQARALRVIAREQPVRMADLADRLHVAPRSATDVVGVLAEGGWVARAPDPGDQRVRAIRLTPAGESLLGAVEAARARAAHDLLAPLPASRREALMDALTTLVEATPHRPP